MVDVLAEATALLQAGGRELRRIAAMCRQAQWALRRAVDQVRAAPPPPESLTEWRHDLRARVGTIAGWTRFFDRQRDDATRIRTLEIIERNAKLLADLVAHPPV